MALKPDQVIAHYRIIEKIGEGGMGEVWRAEDVNLGRAVAIKLLPAELAGDAERRARFEREARLLGSLNHPNIATIHGLHEHEGIHFLAMEMIEGGDLSQRLEKGGLSVQEAVAISRQIAEALETAHDSGVIHRDLKPANIMLTDSGQVKILDFGLAKNLLATEQSGADLEHSPTVTAAGTVDGVILGTVSYMSPEQARGQAVDRRADIWAFGCVLYEMLTGQRAFQAGNLSDALATLLTREPDWQKLPSTVPRSVRHLLRRCLDKTSRTRLRDIGEARIMLDAPEESTAAPLHGGGAAATRLPAERWLLLGAVAVLTAALAWQTLAPGPVEDSADDPSVRDFTLQRLTETAGAERNPSIAPDGRQFLYDSAVGPHRDIFLQRVSGARSINLTRNPDSDDHQAAFSPDGERIAFRSERDGGGLFVMGATGESVRRVTTTGFNPAWSPDGTRLAFASEGVDDPYSRQISSQMALVDLASGEVRPLETGKDAVQPAWSPDGRHIAYWANLNGQRDVWTIPSDGGQPTALTDDLPTDWSPTWSPDGRWIYFSSDRGGNMNLWRIPVDPDSGRATGTPQRVTGGVRDVGHGTLSADGSHIVFMAYERSIDLTFHTLDPDDPCTIIATRTLAGQAQTNCELSPDGQSLACQVPGAREDIVVMDVDGSDVIRLTDDVDKDRSPKWTADNENLVFHSTRSGSWEYWTIRRDGSGLRQVTDLDEISGLALQAGSGSMLVNASYYDELWLGRFDRLNSRDNARLMSGAPAGFSPISWARDHDRVLGMIYANDGRVQGYGIYDPSSESYAPLPAPDPAPPRQRKLAGWLPDARRAVLVAGNDVVVHDSVTGDSCPITPMEPLTEIALSHDGQTLTLQRHNMDSALWLMRFTSP